MKLRTLGVGAAALAMVASPAMAAKWVVAYFDTAKVSFIDTDSRTLADGKGRAWFQIILAPKTVKDFDAMVQYVEFGCREGNFRDLQTQYYKNGNVFYTDSVPEVNSTFVPPETMIEFMHQSVCKPDPKKMLELPANMNPNQMSTWLFKHLADAGEKDD